MYGTRRNDWKHNKFNALKWEIKRIFKGSSDCLVKLLAEKHVSVIDMKFGAFGNFVFSKYDYWGNRCVCVMYPRSCISRPHLFATTTFNITIGVFRLLFLKYPHFFFLLKFPFYPLLWWERHRIFVLCSHRTLNNNNK